VTIETYKLLTQQLLQHDLELVEEQARLDQIRNEPRGPAPGDPPVPAGEAVAAFYALPEVAEIQARLTRARDRLAQAGRIARDSRDPAWVDAKKRVDDLQAQVDALWARRKPPTPQAGRPRPGSPA
jgi:hypothetical protein